MELRMDMFVLDDMTLLGNPDDETLFTVSLNYIL